MYEIVQSGCATPGVLRGEAATVMAAVEQAYTPRPAGQAPVIVALSPK